MDNFIRKSFAGADEDMTNIFLNVKQISLKMGGEGLKRLEFSATGPGEDTAGASACHLSGSNSRRSASGPAPAN